MDNVSYQLRSATADQQTAIKSLIRSVQINPFGLDWRHFIVAIDESGRLIGCGQIKQHRDGSQELASIAVLPPWRGKGVARAIINRLLIDAPQPLWLTCVAPMTPFYENFGFQEIKDPTRMSPYFRRIRQFARIWIRLARLVKRRQPIAGLAIMQWHGQ